MATINSKKTLRRDLLLAAGLLGLGALVAIISLILRTVDIRQEIGR